MPETTGSHESGSNEHLTASLYSALEEIVGDCDTEIGELHGCVPPVSEALDLSFIPKGRKITLVNNDPKNRPSLYYVKTDAHDSDPFLMPNGKLFSCSEYRVSSIDRTESSWLQIRVNEEGGPKSFFFTNSVEGLDFRIVDRNEAELADDLLEDSAHAIKQYESSVHGIEELRAKVMIAEEAIEALPLFSLDSSARYSLDLFYGGRLYAVDEDRRQATLLREFNPSLGAFIHGTFVGNRIEIIDGKILVVDEQTGLGVGAVYNAERKSSSGLSDLKVVNTEDRFISKHIRNEDLRQSELSQQTKVLWADE